MELTVKEFAARERVTERTVWNWRDKGAVEFRKTPGGGIRIIDRREPRLRVFGERQSSESLGNPSE